jgi:hypothetical protein
VSNRGAPGRWCCSHRRRPRSGGRFSATVGSRRYAETRRRPSGSRSRIRSRRFSGERRVECPQPAANVNHGRTPQHKTLIHDNGSASGMSSNSVDIVLVNRYRTVEDRPTAPEGRRKSSFHLRWQRAPAMERLGNFLFTHVRPTHCRRLQPPGALWCGGIDRHHHQSRSASPRGMLRNHALAKAQMGDRTSAFVRRAMWPGSSIRKQCLHFSEEPKFSPNSASRTTFTAAVVRTGRPKRKSWPEDRCQMLETR